MPAKACAKTGVFFAAPEPLDQKAILKMGADGGPFSYTLYMEAGIYFADTGIPPRLRRGAMVTPPSPAREDGPDGARDGHMV